MTVGALEGIAGCSWDELRLRWDQERIVQSFLWCLRINELHDVFIIAVALCCLVGNR